MDKPVIGIALTVLALVVLGVAKEAYDTSRARREAQRLLTPRKPKGENHA